MEIIFPIDVFLYNMPSWLLQVIATARARWLGQRTRSVFPDFPFQFCSTYTRKAVADFHSSHTHCRFNTFLNCHSERTWCQHNILLHSFPLQETSLKCPNFVGTFFSVGTVWILTLLFWQWCGAPVCVSVKVTDDSVTMLHRKHSLRVSWGNPSEHGCPTDYIILHTHLFGINNRQH